MKIGLIGLPKTGKTTIFNALTKSEADVSAYASGKTEPNVAIVNVADARVDRLSALYKPKKTVWATIELTDFIGVSEVDKDSAEQKELFPPALMKLIKAVDALGVVVRNFPGEMSGAPAPLAEVNKIDEELLLSDLMLIEKRLEKVAQSIKRGEKNPTLPAEEKILRRLVDHLNAMEPVRTLQLSEEERKIIRGFQLLTQKPLIVILNSAEDNFGKNAALIAEIAKLHHVVEFSGSFEMELSRLSDEEATLFMQESGIAESARSRLTIAAYATMGSISFFTVGEDEVRAWNIIKGEKAIDAAGTIHSDLARGFIAAECFHYDDLVALGSEKAVKEKGKFKLEGKEYPVKDGDILNIRFNV